MASKKMTAWDVLGIDRDTAVVNVLALYAESTDEQRAIGQSWYERADDIAVNLAIRFNRPHEICAAILAACSPQAPWLWDESNKQCNTYRAVEILTAQAMNRPLRNDGSCLSNREWVKAYGIANGDYADFREGLGTKLKVPSFFDSIINRGTGSAVCIDTHMVCLASNRLMGANHPTIKAMFADNDRMSQMQDLVRECSVTVGERYPQMMQAILWSTWKEKYNK